LHYWEWCGQPPGALPTPPGENPAPEVAVDTPWAVAVTAVAVTVPSDALVPRTVTVSPVCSPSARLVEVRVMVVVGLVTTFTRMPAVSVT
jgi:hypothetical protein